MTFSDKTRRTIERARRATPMDDMLKQANVMAKIMDALGDLIQQHQQLLKQEMHGRDPGTSITIRHNQTAQLLMGIQLLYEGKVPGILDHFTSFRDEFEKLARWMEQHPIERTLDPELLNEPSEADSLAKAFRAKLNEAYALGLFPEGKTKPASIYR